MKKEFWQSNWFVGLAVALGVALSDGSDLLEKWERSLYDWGVRKTQSEAPNNIAVIAIDDASLENLGRWPWPRDIHARLIDYISTGKPKAIGLAVFFSEEERERGSAQIDEILTYLKRSKLRNQAVEEVKTIGEMMARVEPVTHVPLHIDKRVQRNLSLLNEMGIFFAKSSLYKELPKEVENIEQQLLKAKQGMNADLGLAQAIKRAGNVVLPMTFTRGEQHGKPKMLPKYLAVNEVTSIWKSPYLTDMAPLLTNNVTYPIDVLGSQAASIGHLIHFPDVDGGYRKVPLVVDYYDHLFPSMALLLAGKSLNLEVEDVHVRYGKGVGLGQLEIATDHEMTMNTFFYGGENENAFAMDSFFDVYSKKVPAEKYEDKIVLIGATAIGLGTQQVTPVNAAMSQVQGLAHTVAGILKEDFFTTPEWAENAKWVTFALFALFVSFVLPHLRASVGVIFTLVLLSGLLSTHYVLMTEHRLWIKIMVPLTLLVLGFVVILVKRFRSAESGELRSRVESAENNRMLGLAFQAQGQLDMAFEKFMKVPLDESMMEVLANLGKDFERKRQFGKAVSVYKHMESFDANYRDLKKRIERADKLENTVILGGATVGPGGGSSSGTLVLSSEGGGSGSSADDIQKPMLGRYEVEKELGKGAMGVVYLGRDPKINRVVAIKTMALAQEFEPDELKEVKARFFREAESAGRLNHPNIVTMYDIGEEHDLAYIAMEFLSGHDLVEYTKKDNLLPLSAVVNIIARTAMALDYAHGNNVVHRDIKPANIMYDPKQRSIKITDFGIARLTDSSKTKTGMVMGTPSYMSPEQLSGKKVDGRSDLFSLGVMFYQLVCGELPFKAAAMATLLYKITHEEAPDPRVHRKDLPPCIVAIIKKAMMKDSEVRYQKGSEMARDLVKCAKVSMAAKK